MVKYWPQMVNYWTLDGEIQASGWVKSVPEMLPEKLGTVLERKNKTNGWSKR
jgi:hypothetical protein